MPVVTGHPDMTVIDQIIELALTAAGHGTGGRGGTAGESDAPATAARPGRCRRRRGRRCGTRSPGWPSTSSPARPASPRCCAPGCWKPPFNTASLPLDIGYSDSVPAHIRRAVALRDQGCAWPRCRRPASVCDVHHLVHKKDGGKTAVSSCVLLCQFHHDICIHRWGWQLILHPDGTTEARGPDGQILRSHSPPTLRAG